MGQSRRSNIINIFEAFNDQQRQARVQAQARAREQARARAEAQARAQVQVQEQATQRALHNQTQMQLGIDIECQLQKSVAIPMIDCNITLDNLNGVQSRIVRLGDANPEVVRALRDYPRITVIVVGKEATSLAIANISTAMLIVVIGGARPEVVRALNGTPVRRVLINNRVKKNVVQAIPPHCVVQTLGEVPLEAFQALQNQRFGLNMWSSIQLLNMLPDHIQCVHLHSGTSPIVIVALRSKRSIREVVIDYSSDVYQVEAIPGDKKVFIEDALPDAVHALKNKHIVITESTTPAAVRALPHDVYVQIRGARVEAIRELGHNERVFVIIDSDVTIEQSQSIPSRCPVCIANVSKEVVSRLNSRFVLITANSIPDSVRALRNIPVERVQICQSSNPEAVRAIPARIRQVVSYEQEVQHRENPENIQTALDMREIRIRLLDEITAQLAPEDDRQILSVVDDEQYTKALRIAREGHRNDLADIILTYKDKLGFEVDEVKSDEEMSESVDQEGKNVIRRGFWKETPDQTKGKQRKRRSEKRRLEEDAPDEHEQRRKSLRLSGHR